MMRRTRAGIGAALLLALMALMALAAACGGNDPTPPTPTPPAATASATVAPAPTPAASPTGQPSATAPGTVSTQQPPRPAPSATSPAPSGPSVTVSAVGDVCLARQVVDRMAANGADYPFALVAPLLQGDILAGNFEGALTERGDPWPKSFNFRTPPRYAEGLARAGFDVVSLANNHAMDYGVTGLLDTFAALDAAGIAYAGAGDGIPRAYAPVIIERNGLRVAFLAWVATPDEGSGFSISQWFAQEGAPGVAYPSDRAIADTVRAARAQADFVIVMPHAGTEYRTAPDATQRRIAEAALAAGADAVIGAHAHVPQPIEQRGRQLIAWGLGNFVFDLDQWDLAGIPEPRVSLVLNLTLTKGAGVTAWEYRAVALDNNEDRPRPATPAEGAALGRILTP